MEVHKGLGSESRFSEHGAQVTRLTSSQQSLNLRNSAGKLQLCPHHLQQNERWRCSEMLRETRQLRGHGGASPSHAQTLLVKPMQAKMSKQQWSVCKDLCE